MGAQQQDGFVEQAEYAVEVRRRTRTDAAARADGWSNALSGFGGAMDKRMRTTFRVGALLRHQELNDLYASDGLVTRIIDAIPDDITREWVRLVNARGVVGKTERRIFDEMRRLEVQSHVNEALKWARLHGGALLFVGARDGARPESPLSPARVKAVEYLRLFDLVEIDTAGSEFNTDLRSPYFGQIERYRVNARVGGGTERLLLHRSRCIPFYGQKLPPSGRASASTIESRYWGSSVMTGIFDYLRDFQGAMSSVSSILYEFIIGKYKLSDLDEMLAQGNEGLMQTRIQIIETTKSVLHAVLLGSDEEYSRDAASLSGIPDTLDRYMMLLSAVSEIPVTRLFGRSAAGLNATGENDTVNYYDKIRSDQTKVTPAVQKIVAPLAWSLGVGEAEVPQVVWNPLKQLSEKEEADKERVRAETVRTLADADQRYLQEGVLGPEEVYALRFASILGPKAAEDFPLPDVPDVPELPDDPEGDGEDPDDEGATA